ncbi:MAG: hypothetical protein IT436_15085, partial [Phycisphaerales bacterium]|nr:hypothetical protein [Phycisphaerales bacterium]
MMRLLPHHHRFSAGMLLSLVLAAGSARAIAAQAPPAAPPVAPARASVTGHAKLQAAMQGAQTLVMGDKRAEVLPDGSIRLTTIATGRVVIYFPDGSERLERSDGRYLLFSPDGTLEWRASDGSVIRRQSLRKVGASVAPTATSSWAAWATMPVTAAPSDAAPAPGDSPASTPPPPASAPPSSDSGSQRITLPDGSTMSLPPTGFSTVGSSSAPPPPPPPPPPPSDPSAVVTVEGDRPPAIPTDVVAKARLDGGFKVTWTDASTDEMGFQLERSPSLDGGPVTLAPGMMEFSDQQDLPEASYRIRALGERLHSEWTSWVDVRSAT